MGIVAKLFHPPRYERHSATRIQDPGSLLSKARATATGNSGSIQRQRQGAAAASEGRGQVTMSNAATKPNLIAHTRALEAAGIAIKLVMRVPAPLKPIADQVIRSASRNAVLDKSDPASCILHPAPCTLNLYSQKRGPQAPFWREYSVSTLGLRHPAVHCCSRCSGG